ncbi:hypothetical protein ACFQ68_28265 [Amycolatopsis japonica]|uniref:hypothetical protein n=1 Tax=Amycolatopsis japonica TaxID=208439 RepID=UPI00366AA803
MTDIANADADEPISTLAGLTADYRAAMAAAEVARTALTAGIQAAYRAGARQADIVRAIDHEWSGEYVRRIVKAVK